MFAVNRVLLVVAVAMTLVLSPSARAEESKRTWVVGILSNASGMDEPILSDFRQRLHELGYIEGQNLKIEFRTAQNQANQVSKLAEQLIELKVDTIFCDQHIRG